MKYITDTEIECWAFQDINDGKIYPPDICPIFPSRREAWEEKRKYPVYYENTKVVKVLIKIICQTHKKRK